MLYRPDAFEPLTETVWDEVSVRAAIRAIVGDGDAAWRGPKLFWQADPWDNWHATSPMKNLYCGTAGVLWALDQLRRRGFADTALDLADLGTRNVELFRAKPDFPKGLKLPTHKESALLTGEAGMLLVAWRLGPSADLADDLLQHVHANVGNDAQEVMWGAAGTLIAARAMLEWTGESRWREAWHDSAEALLSRRREDGLWLNRLFGREYQSLTPPHGLVGNVGALRPLLDDKRREALERDAAGVLASTAVIDNGAANWPPSPRPELAGPDGEIRVQWCAGSPGIVIGAAEYLEEELLLMGAELPWRTGPPSLDKGPGICHGTAGNGYAFLKVFARTGDERWLDRARRFAMHALEQVKRLRKERGRGRYSLWTGHVGVAVYAADCLEARTDYPIFDVV
jgi:hypothetical protein